MNKEDINKICAMCENADYLFDEDFILCKKNGVMKKSSHCRKFSFDPMKHIPSVKKELPEFEYIDIE